jgi:hypothetical protein
VVRKILIERLIKKHRGSCLGNTGELAYLHRQDPWYEACRPEFARLHTPLVTTVPPSSTRAKRMEQGSVWAFLRSEAVIVCAISNDDIPHLHSLRFRSLRIDGRRRFTVVPRGPG